jgi:hypothetical protein
MHGELPRGDESDIAAVEAREGYLARAYGDAVDAGSAAIVQISGEALAIGQNELKGGSGNGLVGRIEQPDFYPSQASRMAGRQAQGGTVDSRETDKAVTAGYPFETHESGFVEAVLASLTVGQPDPIWLTRDTNSLVVQKLDFNPALAAGEDCRWGIRIWHLDPLVTSDNLGLQSRYAGSDIRVPVIKILFGPRQTGIVFERPDE